MSESHSIFEFYDKPSIFFDEYFKKKRTLTQSYLPINCQLKIKTIFLVISYSVFDQSVNARRC